MLFEGAYINISDTSWDVTVDSQRFQMIKQTEQESAPRQVNVVLNWFEELKRHVP